MADELDPVVFAVLAEIQGALENLATVQDAVGETAAKVSESSDQMTASTERASLGFKQMAEAAGIFAAVDFLKDSVQAASQAAAAEAILDQAIKNTGQSYEALKPQVENVTEQMRALGFTNEDTMTGLARMTQMMHDPEKAMGDMGLAANIARARNIDLAQAVRIVGMAATGHVAMLTRLGIQTKDAAGHTLTAAAAMQHLQETFKGTASAYAGTMQGQMEVFKAQLDDTKEKVGAALIPVLRSLLPIFQQIVTVIAGMVVPIFSTLGKAMTATHGILGVLIVAILAGVAAFKVANAITTVYTTLVKGVQAAIALLIPAQEAETAAQEGVNAAMEANPIGFIIGLLAALVTAVIYCWNHFQGFRDVVVAVFNDIASIIGQVGSFIINDFIKPQVDAFLGFAKTLVTAADDAFGWVPIVGSGLDSAKNAVDSFASSTDATLSSWASGMSTWGDQSTSAANTTAKAVSKASADSQVNINQAQAAANAVANSTKAAHASHSSHAASAKASSEAARKHAEEVKRAHEKALRERENHQREMEALAKKHAQAQLQILKEQIKESQDRIRQMNEELKAQQQQDINIVNGQYANVGTSMLNIGSAAAQAAPSQTNVTVNVSGSVVAQQELVTAVQQGLLAQQRTNASLGIKAAG